MSRRRGVSILFVVGALTLMSMIVFALAAQTSQRYAQSRRFEDRLQALQVAQAGLLWAQRELAQGRSPESRRLDLAPVGEAIVTVRHGEPLGEIEVVGQVVRDGQVMASRRMVWALSEVLR